MRSEAGRLAALLLLGALLALRAIDPLPVETLRLRGFDLAQRLAPRPYHELEVPVRIVAIDEKSLASFGQWPWPRTLIARLVDRIAAAEPRVLAVDALFVEPDRLSPGEIAAAMPDLPEALKAELGKLPRGDAALAAAFERVPTVLGLGVSNEADPARHGPLRVTPVTTGGTDARHKLPVYEALIASRPDLRAAERGRGVLGGNADADGVTRRVQLAVIAEGKLVPALAAETLRVALRGGLTLEGDLAGATGLSVGELTLPTDRRGRAYPHLTRAYEARFVSASDLLEGRADASRLQGGIVLLGVTGLGLVDVKQTPIGPMDGVEIHAQTIEAALIGKLLHRPGLAEWGELALALLAGLVAIFALPYRRPAAAGASAVGLSVALLGGEFLLFRFGDLLIDGIYSIIALGTSFGVMLNASLRTAERARRALAEALQREREAKARIEGELDTARIVQMGLLSRRFLGLPERRDVETYAVIEPARTVGGDLYDVMLIDERLLFFMVADVTGKGVAAALFMATCKEVLRTAALRHRSALDLAFAEANGKIAAASNDIMIEGATMMFVTVCAGVLDLATGALVHASAGHDAPFSLKPGAAPVALATAGGPPLGVVEDFPFTCEDHQLALGEVLLLFTDGVTEAQNPARAFYTAARLRQALGEAQPREAKAAVELARDDLRRFVGEAEATDDITLLGVRWLGTQGSEEPTSP